jgi:hypothetical protein
MYMYLSRWYNTKTICLIYGYSESAFPTLPTTLLQTLKPRTPNPKSWDQAIELARSESERDREGERERGGDAEEGGAGVCGNAMAFSRVFKPHVLFNGGRGIAGFGSRLLSEGVVESSSGSGVSGESSSSSSSSSGIVAASLAGLRAESVGGIDDGMEMEVEKENEKNIGRGSSSSVFRKGSGTVVGRSLALYRREYDRQIAELRKKYAAEQERKKREEMQVKKLERERIMLEKAQRLVIKKQQAEIRAREVEEEAKALRLTLVRFVLFLFLAWTLVNFLPIFLWKYFLW